MKPLHRLRLLQIPLLLHQHLPNKNSLHTLEVNKAQSKEEIYLSLRGQMAAILEGEKNQIANLANFCAVLKEAFNWWWVGFYLIDQNELVLGPFQGPLACTRIAYGKGVCGSAWKEERTLIVPDVEQFPGHIACSAASRSEIVIPLKNKLGQIMGVLDIDSDQLNHFNETDAKYLEEMVGYLDL